MRRSYDIAVYYFPQYHVDPRNESWHGAGWTEWELVKRAEARFTNHEQPKVPLWGYRDEADPTVAAQNIEAAVHHGINAFIFDWYWYEDGPFLNRALDEGFLEASNKSYLKFALMWANHDWQNIFPCKRSTEPTVLLNGAVSRAAFDAATDHVMRRYMTHPSYWRIAGTPYFSFFDVLTLVRGLGGTAATRDALDTFRYRAEQNGLGRLHLNAVIRGIGTQRPSYAVAGDSNITNDLITQLGFDSVTSYCWFQHVMMESFPAVEYRSCAKKAAEDWKQFAEAYGVPYYPNVSMGWDPSPRTEQSDVYENLGYPFTPVIVGNTPEEFEAALCRVKEFVEQSADSTEVITINAWNEWTEGSYLEPDQTHGLAYLEAIRRVFTQE